MEKITYNFGKNKISFWFSSGEITKLKNALDNDNNCHSNMDGSYRITSIEAFRSSYDLRFITEDILSDEVAKNRIVISEIKRLSDGKEFEVNKQMTFKGIDFIIDKITINNSKFYLAGHCTGANINIDADTIIEKNIDPSKRPMFYTEDGAPIYKGDYWYYVVLSKIGKSNCKPNRTNNLKGKPINNDTVKRFSTYELANNFINNHGE